jgi:hypothetical protein
MALSLFLTVGRPARMLFSKFIASTPNDFLTHHSDSPAAPCRRAVPDAT